MTSEQVLRDDVAIVTGAGRNIGRAIAERFAEEGAKVVIADVNEERATSTAEDLEAAGHDAFGVVTDVTDRADVRSLVEQTEDEFGPVDILVNNAAITDRTDFMDLSADEFDSILDVNLRGPFLCTQEAARSMRDSGGGRIVNIASTSAHRARASAVAYTVSKSGLLNFTRSTAKALAEYNIRVNAVSPTRSGTRLGEEETRSGDVDDDILIGRWGRPEDQASAVLFLVSPESEFVNATELVVDGGSQAG